MTENNDTKLVERLSEIRKQFHQEISKRIIGQTVVLDHILIALLSRGHTLIVGVPGLAKTLMIKSLSELLDLKFSRIRLLLILCQVILLGLKSSRKIKTQENVNFDSLKVPFSVIWF